MDLSDNKWISAELAETLRRDNWTLELLATASPRALTTYKNVGLLTAQRIVNEAQRIVNEHKAYEAGQMEHDAIAEATRPAAVEAAPAAVVVAGDTPPTVEPHIQRSVRVQRLIDLNKRNG